MNKEETFKELRKKIVNESYTYNLTHISSALSVVDIFYTFFSTQNFKEFSKHLKSLEKNLYLYGNVGTGKSMFCAELIKRNTDKMPLYFLASDLAYLTKSKCVEILNAQSSNNCGLFVIAAPGN